jgi:hypothetical protein
MIEIPNLQLLIVDCVDYDRAKLAFDHCSSFIKFGDSTILTSIDVDSPEVKKIPHIGSIDDYSNFMIYELHKYVTKDIVLIAQWDGFIRAMELWDDQFLQYDYIGAPWPPGILFSGVPKQFNVGNGGFSIRSKKLIEFMATDKRLTHHYLEDVMICQLNRAYLEMNGFSFAPEDVAAKFSWECGPEHPSFGVHQRIKLVRPTIF